MWVGPSSLPMRVIAQILGCRSLDKYTMLPPHKYRPTVPQIPWELYHSVSFSCGYDLIYRGRCKMWIAARARSPNTFDVILREGAINKAVKGSQTKRAGAFKDLWAWLVAIHCFSQMPIIVQVPPFKMACRKSSATTISFKVDAVPWVANTQLMCTKKLAQWRGRKELSKLCC